MGISEEPKWISLIGECMTGYPKRLGFNFYFGKLASGFGAKIYFQARSLKKYFSSCWSFSLVAGLIQSSKKHPIWNFWNFQKKIDQIFFSLNREIIAIEVRDPRTLWHAEQRSQRSDRFRPQSRVRLAAAGRKESCQPPADIFFDSKFRMHTNEIPMYACEIFPKWKAEAKSPLWTNVRRYPVALMYFAWAPLSLWFFYFQQLLGSVIYV